MAKRSIVQVGRFAGTYGSLISQEELDRITPKASEPGYVDPNCKHLTRMLYGHTVLKCAERPNLTHGKATDQKAGWNACGRFEEGENRRFYPSH
jgi:hypothetical protein